MLNVTGFFTFVRKGEIPHLLYVFYIVEVYAAYVFLGYFLYIFPVVLAHYYFGNARTLGCKYLFP